MAEAAEQVVAAKSAQKPPNVKTQALLAYVLTSPEGTTSMSRATARELALRWFPASPRLMHFIAEDAFQRREFQPATQLLERLLLMGRTGQFDRSHAFDPELLGDRARVNLAACYYNLGEAAKAEQCYRPLLANERYRAQASQGIAAAQQLQRKGGRFSFDINDVAMP
jgi:tetratricopeptide (TPR) repeat protein